MVDDPLGVIRGMIKHDIDDTEHTLIPLALKRGLQLFDSLSRSEAARVLEIVVIDSRLASDRVVTE